MTDDKLREMATELLAAALSDNSRLASFVYVLDRLKKVRDLSKPQWLPIDRAPRDGKPFIARWKNGSISDCVSTSNPDPLRAWRNLRGEYLLPPTYFLPPPEPPK